VNQSANTSHTCQLYQNVNLVLPYELRQLRLWQQPNVAPHATNGSNLQQRQQQFKRFVLRRRAGYVTAAALQTSDRIHVASRLSLLRQGQGIHDDNG
jgi:hypothetical protein